MWVLTFYIFNFSANLLSLINKSNGVSVPSNGAFPSCVISACDHWNLEEERILGFCPEHPLGDEVQALFVFLKNIAS
jgi:hypothetical protein